MTSPGAIIIEGHVQGLSNTRSLGEMGVPVYVVDKTNCIARYSKYCNKFFQCPDFDSDAFADFLIALGKTEPIQDWVLIPSNDHAVYTIAKHKDQLTKVYKVITPDLDIVHQIYDKVKLINLAVKIGVPVPATQTFQNINDGLGIGLKFPVITKGRNGLSFYKTMGKKAVLANDAKELRTQLSLVDEQMPIEQAFTQELIPFDGQNKTLSFTAFCVQGEIKAHWTGVKLREHPVQFGTATFTMSTYNNECHEQSSSLLKALNYTGVCEVEYLLDPRDNQYKLIEINPRTWLWVGLAKACGVDYAKMIYKYVNDLPIRYPEQYQIGRYWINPVTDTVFAFVAILKGKLNFFRYVGSLLQRKKVNALVDIRDMKPAFAYLLQIFSFIKRR
jgi:predicted ATP-grasp superfamily ATP-dependent carboligase